jgi:hypothetical protein
MCGMKRWFPESVAEAREGFRILRSRGFWAAFRCYWSSEQVAKRMNAWAERAKR